MPRGLPEPGEILAEKYLVTRQIGRGGMGAVYVVEHRMTGKKLAVKCLLPEHSEHPELVERFLREAAAAGRIQHRNVVDVFDVGRDGELLYIVMELLEGKTLSDLLRDSALPLNDVLLIVLRAMEGVAAAHAHGIVHRDLKPENIMVCAGQSGLLDDPRVLDFGISKLDEDASKSLTKSGVMMGTPYYMSFEQIASQRDLDQRVDVYAMGVILYEAISGRVPYTAESVGALAVQMMSAPPTPLSDLRPDLPAPLVSVIMRAIAKERDQRFPTMQALIDALRPFVVSEMGPVTGTRSSLPLMTPSRSLRLSEAGTLPASSSNSGPRSLQGAVSVRSTPAGGDTPLRVFEHDEVPARPAPTVPPQAGKLALFGVGAVLAGALAFILWPRGEESPPPIPAAAPAAQTAPKALPPAVQPSAEPVHQGAADVTVDAAAALEQAAVDAAAPQLAEPEPEEERDARGVGKKRGKKRGGQGRSLEDMVPAAPTVPDEEREPAPEPAKQETPPAESAPEPPKEPAAQPKEAPPPEAPKEAAPAP